MARSSAIYLLRDSARRVCAAYTVRHELASELSRRHPEINPLWEVSRWPQGWTVLRVPDGKLFGKGQVMHLECFVRGDKFPREDA